MQSRKKASAPNQNKVPKHSTRATSTEKSSAQIPFHGRRQPDPGLQTKTGEDASWRLIAAFP